MEYWILIPRNSHHCQIDSMYACISAYFSYFWLSVSWLSNCTWLLWSNNSTLTCISYRNIPIWFCRLFYIEYNALATLLEASFFLPTDTQTHTQTDTQTHTEAHRSTTPTHTEAQRGTQRHEGIALPLLHMLAQGKFILKETCIKAMSCPVCMVAACTQV